jgi:hypothetical protein
MFAFLCKAVDGEVEEWNSRRQKSGTQMFGSWNA